MTTDTTTSTGGTSHYLQPRRDTSAQWPAHPLMPLRPTADHDTVVDDDVDPGLPTYWRQMSAYPLLSRDEEYALSKRAQSAPTSPPEERLLASLDAHSADDARTRLVEHNLRLAAEYVLCLLRGRAQIGTLDLDDLLQAASLGLMMAAARYDYRRGNRFSTIAWWWIGQQVNRALDDESHTLGAPTYVWTAYRKVVRAVRAFEMEHAGRVPTDEELLESGRVDAKSLSVARMVQEAPDSLDREVSAYTHYTGDNAVTYLGDLLADTEAVDPEEMAVERDEAERVRAWIAQELEPRERLVLDLRLGLSHPDGRVQSLVEVGKRLGVCRERVRQIEADALAKLRQRAAVLRYERGGLTAASTSEERSA